MKRKISRSFVYDEKHGTFLLLVSFSFSFAH